MSTFSIPQKKIQSNWPEWSALGLYAALVAFAIPYHEPWADEAQAWQLARSLSLGSLFKTYIRYEGSPGLWYFLLWILKQFHVNYAGLHWTCGAIATMAVWLLLFKSSLPRYLKLSLPFTYFLVFQYAVVARSYVLAPLLFFLTAMAWKKNPLGLAVALGLLANVSLHTAVLSGGMAIVYLIEQTRNREGRSFFNRQSLLPCGILLAFYLFAIWTAWPPHDSGFGYEVEASQFAVAAIRSLTWPICDPHILSVLFWAVIALWFIARRKLLYLLPLVFFATFSGAVATAWWHAGLLLPYLICVLWITWPAPGTGRFEFDKAARSLLVVMILMQTIWSGAALYYDHYFAYSPDGAAAEFLKPYVEKNVKIVVTYMWNDHTWPFHAFHSVGIQAYFDHNIFANTPYPFWWWSKMDRSQDLYWALLPTRPGIVVVEFPFPHPPPKIDLGRPEFTLLLKDGYQYREAFCGAALTELAAGAGGCHVIFEYSSR